MSSRASLMILRTKLIEEKRTLDNAAGRLLKHKITLDSDEPDIQTMILDAANSVAKGSARIEVVLEHLDMRL